MARKLCFKGEGSEAKKDVLDGLRCRQAADHEPLRSFKGNDYFEDPLNYRM